jgi:hypothetical protein
MVFQKLLFLARSPTIKFYTIYADTLWIHVPYRIWESGVKLKSKKWDFDWQKCKIQIAKLTFFVGI